MCVHDWYNFANHQIMTVKIDFKATKKPDIPYDPWQSDLYWHHRQSHESYLLRRKTGFDQL